MPNCRSCGQGFDNWTTLAQHIIESKRGHNSGRVWASNLLLKTKALNAKRELQQSTATVEEKAAMKVNKMELRQMGELSGDTERVIAGCPSCHRPHQAELPVEFVRSEYAWRTENGMLLTRCEACK
jgi:hypothetical protein